MKIDKRKWKEILLAKGSTQQTICDLLKLSRARFSQRLNNNGKFTSEEIKQIANYLDIDPASFVYDEISQLSANEPITNYMNSKQNFDEVSYLKMLCSEKDKRIQLLEQQLEGCKSEPQKERRVSSG